MTRPVFDHGRFGGESRPMGPRTALTTLAHVFDTFDQVFGRAAGRVADDDVVDQRADAGELSGDEE